ncbi:protein kinase [Colletotrichum salicis]|uniref:Protein kinase n=1 Tax=Colletotrichum salicis TaxID=1209931 RepID=A0A135S5W2_9PEZI|nr:protein kinase [Colletotrichum salicis]
MIETTPENEAPVLPPLMLQPDIMEMTKPLKQLLEGAMCRSFSLSGRSSKEFLPAPDFNRIIAEESVLGALRASCSGADFMRCIYASTIVKDQTHIKTFAILVLIDRVDAIAAFRQNHLGDAQLPLAFSPTPGGETSTLVRSMATRSSFDLSLMGLSHYESILFEEMQWKFLAPVLARADLDGEPREFPESTILPFVIPDLPHGTQWPRNSCSNNSRIYQAHIHDGHHDFSASTVAVKELLNAGPEDYRREVEALKTFGGPDQLHVIELLTTFKRGETYYLVFPWAENDLHGVFTEPAFSLPCGSANAVKPATLTAKQMLGVAEALKAIHYCRLKKRSSKGYHEPAEGGGGAYHGDIKPENILVENGQWKLADFGLFRIGRGTEDPLGDRPAGCSPTYRAPEHDVGTFDGQKADIWSLGCVMSVAATWMTLGRKGVKKFSANRQTKAGTGFDNSFFEVSKDQEQRTRVKLKAAVSHWISRLRRAPRASTFTHDLLDLIRDKMLEVDGSKRISSADVVSSLEKMYEKCAGDPSYTEPAPRRGVSSWTCGNELLTGTPYHEPRSITVNVVEVPDPTQYNQTLPALAPQLDYTYPSASFNAGDDTRTGAAVLSFAFTEPLLETYDDTINQPNSLYGSMNITISPDIGQLGSPNVEGSLPSFEDLPTSRPSLTVPVVTNNRKRRRSTSSENPEGAEGHLDSSSESQTNFHDESRAFACPYFKHNPEKYRRGKWKSCAGAGWEEFHRLKCQKRLPSREELDDHRDSEVQCQRQHAMVDDNMDDAQLSSSQDQLRGKDGAYKWGTIYKIIFRSIRISPEAMPSPSNCLDRDELDRFSNFLESRRQHQIYGEVQREIDICLKWIRKFQNPRSLTQSTIASEVPSLTGGSSNMSTLSANAMLTRDEFEPVSFDYNTTADSSCQEAGIMRQDPLAVGIQFLGCRYDESMYLGPFKDL